MTDQKATDSTTSAARRRPARAPATYYTAFGLFDHSLDAEKSLVALQRDNVPAKAVSLVIRDRASASDPSSVPTGDVSRALVASAMGALGQWLDGLASLIVPERGTYLVAGPVGAILASVGAEGVPEFPHHVIADLPAESDDEFDLIDDGPPHDDADSIFQTMMLFGTTEDDASYLENRLVSGTSLVAVTTADRRTAARGRNEFDTQGAVFLRVVVTGEDTLQLARDALNRRIAAMVSGEVVVTDAVAPLRRMCDQGNDGNAPGCGATLTNEDGTTIGTVADILADPIEIERDGGSVMRYIVAGFGGLLGLGRQYVAIPVELVEFDGTTARLDVDPRVIHDAPRYEQNGAFSRREELAVLAYFGVRPYWLPDSVNAAESVAGPAVTRPEGGPADPVPPNP